MATLQITCLGDYQIALDGAAPNTGITDKVRALLIYLVLEPRVHQRSVLTQMLWSGYGEESARNSLRQTLHRLQQSLPENDPPWLLVTRQTAQINPAATISVDVKTFTGLLTTAATHPHADLATCATCLAALRQAVDLYRGDFLAGLGTIDSDGFEEWRRVTQEQLHIQMLDVLSRLAAVAESVGDTEGALQAAQRQLTLEPWLETAHRQIIRLLAQRGQRAAALAQYQRCRQVLAEELNVEPDAETTALYEQIRTGAFEQARRQGDRRQGETGKPDDSAFLPPVALPPVSLPPVSLPPVRAQLPPLLGRTEELTQMTTLLVQPTCRLVTLVGPPGVGKTRLAQEILAFGSFQELKFEQGIHFVDLAPLRDPTLLATTIAHALSLPSPALQLTGERLTEGLRDQALLLVLDNFEQVLPGAELLRQILTHCPQIKFVITSRMPLHLPGEQVIPVHPLPLPALSQSAQGTITLTTALQNVAVQLFCQRAATVAPGFVLTERLAPVVVEICRRLDGLPLAIELAAARCRLLPPPALLERLTQDLPARLELLTNRSPTLPERQQTLRAAIAWSYDLLTDAEQRLFRQLAVFVGGATLAALEAVIRQEHTVGESPHPSPALLDSIEALLDKSLLRQQEAVTPQPEGEPRLLMLETLREYGWELLAATAEGHNTQHRHADYFLSLAETAAPKLHGPEQMLWLDRLALDHDNLWVALNWLAQAGEVTKALRLATALRYFWRVRGHYREGGERLQQLLARPEAAPTGSPPDPVLATVRARALNAAGYLQWVQGNIVVAQNLLQEALTLGRAVPDAVSTAFALRYLGLAADARQERTTARQFLEESLALYRSLETPNETALALMYLGDITFGQQAYDEAELLYQESADLLRQLGNNVVLPYALRHLGYLALGRGELKRALTLCTESLRLNLAAGEQQGSAAALTAVAAVAVAGDQWVQADRLLASVTAWLTASRAQLLPIDRTYYEQTQQRLQQHHQGNPPDGLADASVRLSMAQALAYVQQELIFADEPRRQSDKVTSDKVTESPSHPVTQSPPHNLPAFATPLVGRDQALAELAALWQKPGVRLLTLVGPGGMGKTRLAVAAGEARLAAFADGVWFVPLASISTADALPGAIANALGITLQGSEPRQALLQSLRTQHLLLLLDNYEHLLAEEAAVDLVVDLLARAPNVQILVTSRQRLNLRGEQLYPVQALTFPSTVTLAEATAASAVRLFVQAVQRVQVDFQLTATNLPAVLRICQLVQGMPLGLELAAANAGSAPLRAIADALEQSAEILAVEWRDLPARQRSMRAVFAWSWQLLSATEQRVLRQSAHFRGGFDYTAAQAVISATPALLTALVNKSLLQWQATAPGEGRYAMHELLRQFAAEALAESDERAVVEERHGRYYLAYLAARGFRLGRSEPKEASAEIQVELDNVRLAWQWAATHGGLAELDQALYAWWQFCLLQGLGGEALQSLAAALAGVRTLLTHWADEAPLRLLGTRLLAKLLALHANFLFAQGRDEEMTAQAREAMQLGAASGGFEGEILGTYVLGRVLQDTYQKREAQVLWQQTLQLIQHNQPQQPENELLHEVHWMTHIMLRGSALHFGDYVGCRAHIVEALRICQTLGKQRGELTSLSCLGEINFYLYDFTAAEAVHRAELALGRSLGYRQSEMSAQEGLARVARLRGDYATARTLLEQSLGTATELASRYDEAHFLAALIRLHCQLGDQTAAAACQDRLTQLLAQVKLGKECHLYACLAAAFKAHYAGDKDEALAAAEQANQINQQGGEILFRLVDTAIILGHVRAAVGQWEAATAAFQEALTAFQQSAGADGAHAVAAEPQAGLAQIALAQGDLAGALARIEALLPVLAQEPHAGYNDPIFIYLTGYRVLVANGDPRAATLLQQGYDLLHQDAAALDDESRQRFLTTVPLHRDLVAAYREMQAQRDRVTSDKVTSDKVTSDKVTSTSAVTESPNHPLTQLALAGAPSRLVTGAPLLDWAEMPMVDFFVERRAEVAQLTAWLTPTATGGVPAQLISILGMGGMGKTTLAAAVTKAVAPHFAVVIWRSLLNAPPLNELLRNWLQTLSRQSLTALPESLDEQLRVLLTYLQQERCLLVLDNVESIFAVDPPTHQPQSRTGESTVSRAGVSRAGYEGYDQLFQRLASSDHQSCLLLTSREQPYALLRVTAGRGRQAQAGGRVQALPLTGLDQQAGHALLASNGLHTSTAEAAQLVENYSGNPLALQIVAATIADFFGGDVTAFRAEDGQLFDGMLLVLDQQFARLSPLEQEVLLWLAIEREPITVPMLRANLVQPVPTSELIEALQALQNRSLLEKRDNGLTLQNVIIEYTTEYLVAQVCREIIDEFGITKYELREAAPDTDLVIRNSKLVTSFLNRFALLKAQAKDYVRRSQSRLLVQPVVARLLDQFGRTNFASILRQQIEHLKGRPNPGERGYAAGNLLNLLLHAGCDLTGCDLSGLAVWQAYLRECTLYDVNLAGADLSGSGFADTFASLTALIYSSDGRLLLGCASVGDIRVWLADTLQPVGMLQGHSRIVMGVAVGSSQSQLLASCGEDGTVRLWNLANLDQPSVILYKTAGFVRTVALSPNDDLLVSAGDDADIQVWHLPSRRAIAILRGHTGIITSLVYSPDGRFVVSCSGDHTIRLWDVSALNAIAPSHLPNAEPRLIDNSRIIHTWSPTHEDVWVIAISPNGQRLAGVDRSGVVWTWQIDKQQHVQAGQKLKTQGAHYSTVLFSPDSSLLVVAAAAKTIWLLDSTSGEMVRQIEGHAQLTSSLAFAPDGKTLASSGSDRVLRLWDLATGRSLQALAGAARAFRDAVFSADGQTVVTCGADRTIRIWEISETQAPRPGRPAAITGVCRHVLQGHSSGIWTVAIDHAGTVVASAGEDCNIILWDRRTGQLLHKLQGHLYTVTALAFSRDGRTLVSGSPDQTVRLWDYHTYQPLAQLKDTSASISVHEQSIWCVALSPDGAKAAAGYSDGCIVIWDIRDRQHCQQIGKIGKHDGWVRHLAFSPDGLLLASGSNDHSVRLWDVTTGALRQILHGHEDWVMSVAFHPQGKLLASGSFDNTIRLWDLATGQPLPPPQGAPSSTPMRHSKGVVAVTFHPHGHLLLSASLDARMTFWHVASQQRLHNLVAPGPYSGLKITGITGISAAQKAALQVLGAVDEAEEDQGTSDKGTSPPGDARSVTESPSHEAPLGPTLSPPHPVPLSALYDWAEMPVVDFFVERTAEVAQLTAWLTPAAPGGPPARLVSILGMGGMGKTTLAAAVTRSVAPHFAVVIWRSLLNAPPVAELLRNWLQILSRQTLTAPPDSLDDHLRLLLTYLQQERCLLILDNVESIFAADGPVPEESAQSQSRAGVTRPGYEGYDQLFQRLATSDHQSCLLLTSREQPYALLRSGRQAQAAGRLQVLPLTGLGQQAGQALLQNNGLHTSPAEAAQLVENYSGNPLALQIVAATIADFFGGDVAAFQQEEGQFFDGLRLVLDQQFARLSPLERDILVWLAMEREPITVPMLRANLVQPVPTNELLEALQALQNRSLLEKRDNGLTLQNVIIEYTTEYLVAQVCREIIDEFGITKYELREAAPDTDLVIRNSKLVTSFLNRFALLKAQAKEYVRQSQVRLIVQPLANRLLTQLGKAQVEERVTALVQQLQAVPVTRGYAGGNLLNLLLHIGSDLRGRDFAHIALWQVFLAGAYAPGLNLAGADLTGTVFTQRFGALHHIQFDVQGDLLLADIDNQRLRLLRLHDGRLYHEVALPAWRFAQPYLSPDCQAVLMTLADHQVTLLDLTTGKLSPAQARHQHPIWRACFSPDGQFVATGDSSGLICLWARPHGQLVQARQITADAISALAIAPDGETMASANVAGMVFLWSLADHAALRRLQGHDDEVATLSFLDNGRLLASGSHDLTVGIWDVATGELRQRLRGHTRPIRKSVATTTGQWLVTGGGDHFLYVWDWQRAAPQHLLAAHASPIEHLVISANGKQAATLDLNTVVSLWDLTQGRRIDYYAIYYNAIMSIQFSPDGETLVTGGSDGAVYLWQVQGGGDLRLTARFVAHKQRIFTVAFHPDGNLIASGGDGSAIALWARSSGQLLHTLQGHAKNISMLAFSPNGQWLASSSGDGAITLWSIPAGRQRRQLQVHSNMVTCCAFSPSRTAGAGQPQQRLASGSFDRTLAIWDAESGALLHHLHGHTNAIGRCIFSHDGQRLISISYDETLRIWDVESGEQLTTWPQLGGGYIALAVHPAGQLLAVSCMDCAIRLLELSSGRCLAELHGHSQPVISLAIHPNEKLLASAGSDETIRLWDISSAALETGQIACLQAMQAPSPYAGMQIGGVTGLSDAQKAALRALGAVDEE